MDRELDAITNTWFELLVLAPPTNWCFGGPHPGGWVALFCDGSVSFLPYEMEPIIHQRLGSRLDGNVIDRSNL